MTDASNASPYCTPAEAVNFYDLAIWGQLTGDVGVEYTAAQIADASTAPGKRLAALLSAASSKVQQACTRGQRYTSDDLAALQGVDHDGLAWLVASIAVIDAHRTRQPLSSGSDLSKEVTDILKRLGDGELIWALEEAQAAGAGMETVLLPDQEPGPRPAISGIASRFFGSRAKRYDADGLPGGRFRGSGL